MTDLESVSSSPNLLEVKVREPLLMPSGSAAAHEWIPAECSQQCGDAATGVPPENAAASGVFVVY
jgi:hypothetical protein